jgi:hypothetical protein
MRALRSAGLAAAVAAIATPALAGTYPLTVVINGPTDGISLIKVDGGEATKPPPVDEQKVRTEFTVDVTLPDGVCHARVSFWIGTVTRTRVDKMMDLCGGVRISIW